MRDPPEGDYFDLNANPNDLLDPVRRASVIQGEDLKYLQERDRVLADVDKVGFPLYSLQSKIASEETPIGNVPLLFYWTRRLKPKIFNRATGN